MIEIRCQIFSDLKYRPPSNNSYALKKHMSVVLTEKGEKPPPVNPHFDVI